MQFLALFLVLVLVIYIQGKIYVKFGFRNFSYTCYFSKTEVTEGDELEFVEVLENHKLLPLPWIKSEIDTSIYLEFEDSLSVITGESRFVPSFFSLKSNSRVSRRWKIKCNKRGVYDIANVQIVSCDLLGRKSISKSVKSNAVLVVFPKAFDYEDLNISSKYYFGEIIIRRSLILDPFVRAGLREYQIGDTMNRINWKATARQQKLMSVNYESSTSINIALMLNMQSHEEEKADVTNPRIMENAIRLCAGIICECEKQNIPLRFLSNSSHKKGNDYTKTLEKFGAEHSHNILHILAKLRLCATRKIKYYLNDIKSDIKSSDIIIVTAYIEKSIIDFANEKIQEGIGVKIITLREIPHQYFNENIDIESVVKSMEGK